MKTNPIIFDTETVGFHGLVVLLQYAIGDGEIYLYEPWRNKISETLDLIERFMRHKDGIIGFNLTYDMFHLNKLYNVFNTAVQVYGPESLEWYPDEHIEDIAKVEKRARDGVCLKPVKALDLFLHARKGEYQSTMDRKDIRIKKVPRQLARPVAEELNKRIKFNKVYFARRKTELVNPWQVFDIKNKSGEVVDDDFQDIVLKFSPSSGLKALAVDAGLVSAEHVLKFSDVAVHEALNPVEVGWAPFAEAIGEPGNWRRTWPDVIKYHIEHFGAHAAAREYSRLDIVYTRGLYTFFDEPELGDDDSELACAIGAIRWKGFAVDLDKIKALKSKALELERTAPKSPSRVKDWIWPHLSETEQATTKGTGKIYLEEMCKWVNIECEICGGEGTTLENVDNDPDYVCEEIKCKCCKGTGRYDHPAAAKAKMVLDARKAKKEVELYDKLIQAGRFHASFKIIGTLSGRMAGADKLNPQGIKSTKEVRSGFPLAFSEDMFELCGGDFESFEVVIAVAVYKDPKLEADLNTLGMCPGCLGTTFKLDKQRQPTDKTCTDCSGSGKCKQKIHGLFGSVLFKQSYDEIVKSKGSDKDLYTDGKRGVFAELYGGNHSTLMTRLGVDEATAIEAHDGWALKYTGIKKSQQRIKNMFCTMVQADGIGSKIEWNEPARFIASLLGFRRYYDLENRITKVLFDLAEKPPKEWTNIKLTVRRRDRDQTAAGAVRSAIFAAAFAIQSANERSATNHEIQSTGAGICKRVQRKIWDLQPTGVCEWVLLILNVHDELMCPCKPELKPVIEKVVRDEVEKFRYLIPMIAIDWSNDLKSWADK